MYCIYMYLQIFLSVVSDLLWFDLPILDIDLVPTHHCGYTLTHMLQVSVPHWHIVVRRSGRYIKHNDGTVCLDVVAVPQSSELLLTSSVPYIELDGPPAGVEHYGVNLNTNRSCVVNMIQ